MRYAYYPDILLENLSQRSRSSGRGFKSGRLEYAAGKIIVVKER